VLGWEVVEREQLLQVVDDLGRGLGELRPVSVLERLGRFAGVVLVLGGPDLGEGLLRPRVRRLRQRGKDIRDLVGL